MKYILLFALFFSSSSFATTLLSKNGNFKDRWVSLSGGIGILSYSGEIDVIINDYVDVSYFQIDQFWDKFKSIGLKLRSPKVFSKSYFTSFLGTGRYRYDDEDVFDKGTAQIAILAYESYFGGDNRFFWSVSIGGARKKVEKSSGKNTGDKMYYPIMPLFRVGVLI